MRPTHFYIDSAGERQDCVIIGLWRDENRAVELVTVLQRADCRFYDVERPNLFEIEDNPQQLDKSQTDIE